MPQARRAGSSPSNPSAPKPATAKRPAAKPAARKTTAAKPAASRAAAAKPAASKATAAKPAAAKSAAAKRPAAKATSAKRPATKTAASKTTASKASTAKNAPRVSIRVNAENVQIDVIAERLRKLNEKIIEFGRDAGDNTLTSYEKALKTIATNVQQSPAKDELEWITNLVSTQAKFVREITDSWAKAARERLK
jgi:chemotaxis protein histidine kinase CheA